jgi:hypothetical protein
MVRRTATLGHISFYFRTPAQFPFSLKTISYPTKQQSPIHEGYEAMQMHRTRSIYWKIKMTMKLPTHVNVRI